MWYNTTACYVIRLKKLLFYSSLVFLKTMKWLYFIINVVSLFLKQMKYKTRSYNWEKQLWNSNCMIVYIFYNAQYVLFAKYNLKLIKTIKYHTYHNKAQSTHQSALWHWKCPCHSDKLHVYLKGTIL